MVRLNRLIDRRIEELEGRVQELMKSIESINAKAYEHAGYYHAWAGERLE